jgi:septal ring factor EnvC (AmiA/AmiB activator)
MPGSSAVLILICMFLQQGRDVVNYIQNELEALEREQKQIDKQAALLEKDLRQVMESGTILKGDWLCVCIKMYIY